jgi:hypothetical protein
LGNIWGCLVGVIFLGVGGAIASQVGPLGMIVVLIGIGIILYFGARLIDNSVKLSFTPEGLKDHRTGVLIRWLDIRGVRLWIYTTNRRQTGAAMYVKIADAEGEREIAVDVHSLDRSPHDIAHLVEKRVQTAIEDQASSPDAAMAALWGEVMADLDGGIPLTFVATKLRNRGMGAEAAGQFLAMAAGQELVQCRSCGLQYRGTVSSCGSCGGPLTPEQAPHRDTRA